MRPALLTTHATPAKPFARVGKIRSQILLAFLAMSVITSALGFFSIKDLEREGGLVDRTFDRSLMSINFARAAAADFNGLQAAVARRTLAKDASTHSALNQAVKDLEASMDDDLSIAVERAQSDRVVRAAQKVQNAIAIWKAGERQLSSATNPTEAWRSLDAQAAVIGQQLDLLVNYTAGDGFIYRQLAHATVLGDKRFTVAATLAAVVLSGLIAWLLSRRVVLPIKTASQIAGRIADGDLDVGVPVGNADELGALLAAMEIMRGNIKSSIDREIKLRQSAQMRLADALDGSFEGIVVIDAESRIAMANAQASILLDLDAPPLCAGDHAERVLDRLTRVTTDGLDHSPAREVEIAEGRWLRVSCSRTREGGSVFVYSDISLLKTQETALKNANFWLDAALDNLSKGVCLFDSNNQLKVYNKRLCELLGYPPEQIHDGTTAAELLALGYKSAPGSEPLDVVQARLARRIAARERFDGLTGEINGRTLSVSHRPLAGDCWMETFEDVTDRLQAAEKIAYMARHDTLTGLPNRGFFGERIENALIDVRRGSGFALLCLDLDHFKEVNDTLGHPIGDELLCSVADRLRAAIRETDMVARLGGDEFAVLQTHVSDPEEVQRLAERIIQSLNGPCSVDGNPVQIGVSIGIAMAPSDGLSYDKLLKSADMALYRAKADGRNRFRFFERAMDERQQARRLIELDLREALVSEQFELDYQPVWDVAEDRIIGFEALVRWRHPQRGLVLPAEFIPIAEEIGLITQLGDWVLRQACHDAMRWPSNISVAVNVSAAQLRHTGLPETVLAALATSGLAARRLVLEITESVLIANAQNALLVLNRFKATGIRIAMDDFGTGYSSLSYLRSFPFDNVKIDKSFISEITTRPEAASIVRAVIALCRSLGMRTTAEGIETESQLAFLKAEGCDEAQGFFFSKPIPATAVPDLLEIQASLIEFFAKTQAA